MTMKNTVERDEHLEKLWHIRDEKSDSFVTLKEHMGEIFNQAAIDELRRDGMVDFVLGSDRITLTKKGEERARSVIRAHRIAERFFYNVLGRDSEKEACEFEHNVSEDLVDSICTILGHPRECPHGLPIPKGKCCERAATSTHSLVMPLTGLKEGSTARVAYADFGNEQRFHKVEGLHLRKDAVIKLCQKNPACVIECEGATIALDEEIASRIYVWKEPEMLRIEESSRASGEDTKGWLRRILGR
jgi:DtxR family Mn-dependent transcriptional regulator